MVRWVGQALLILTQTNFSPHLLLCESLLQQRLHVRALLLELGAQRGRLRAARLELRLRGAARFLERAARLLQLLLQRRLPLDSGQGEEASDGLGPAIGPGVV